MTLHFTKVQYISSEFSHLFIYIFIINFRKLARTIVIGESCIIAGMHLIIFQILKYVSSTITQKSNQTPSVFININYNLVITRRQLGYKKNKN